MLNGNTKQCSDIPARETSSMCLKNRIFVELDFQSKDQTLYCYKKEFLLIGI